MTRPSPWSAGAPTKETFILGAAAGQDIFLMIRPLPILNSNKQVEMCLLQGSASQPNGATKTQGTKQRQQNGKTRAEARRSGRSATGDRQVAGQIY